MKIFVPRETQPGETRAALVPEHAARMVKLGLEVVVQEGLGRAIQHSDDDYRAAGAATAAGDALAQADFILRLGKPDKKEIARYRQGAYLLCHLDPFREPALIKTLAEAGVCAFSVEMIPRSTIAQKMDALSSQANLGGYVAVILAAERLQKIFPMMMTPGGTIPPAKVFVIGAGVAGLQAIATAKRLGARVEAFDTRPVVEEQVKSLGARFVKIDLGDTGQTKDGYAKSLTEEQLQRQREQMSKHCAAADVVITTAQVFGRKAPLILTRDMVAGMRPGSVVVDMAVETGGNVEGSELGHEVDLGGVTVIGLGNLPGRVPVDASLMYSGNVTSFIEHFWNKEEKTFNADPENDIIKSCLLTRDGHIVNEHIASLL